MAASPHAAKRFGLTIMIESQADMEVVAKGGSAEDTVDLLRRQRPDITLIDACLIEADVAEALKLLRREQPECRVLALAIYESDHVVQRAF